LSKKDPFFVTKVKDQQMQIPTLFWKAVVFSKSEGHLYSVGFLMSHATLLKKNKIGREVSDEEALTDEDRLFMEFEEADTYQVNISTIEKLSGQIIPEAKEIYEDDRKIKLILEEIDVRESLLESASIFARIGF
jgi:endonuclease G, mitochondrial